MRSTDALRALGDGNEWCWRPAYLAGFEADVVDHQVIATMGAEESGDVVLRYECTG
jgi:hypothetical protein